MPDIEFILPPLRADAVGSQWEVRPLPFGATQYSQYLKSQEYRDIKERVFHRLGRRCVACDRTLALRIHHRDYRLDVLRGNDIQPLVPMCDFHHDYIHEGKTWEQTEAKLFGLVTAYLNRQLAA